jgi:DNA-binding beta-propeller fold protein YncE
VTPWLTTLVGCGWNHLPVDGDRFLDALWSPDGVVAADDGLYVRLPRSGGLVRVGRGEEPVTPVDLGEGSVRRIDPTPGGNGVLALVERYDCDTEDDLPRRPTVDDCAEADLLRATELVVVRNAVASRGARLDGTYNALEVSADGAWAVAWLDLDEVDVVTDVVNLTGVAVLDVDSGRTVLVPVGFAPERVLFAQDDRGNTTRAVVTSRNEVALVELSDGAPRRTVTFPLALDATDDVAPDDVALTPDGRFAMVTAKDRTDLYVLDLDDPSVNIVELPGTPTDLAVVPDAGVTAVVFGDSPTLQLVDHASFGSRFVALGEPMDHVRVDGDRLLLYGDRQQHELYRYSVLGDDLVAYRVQNPIESLAVSPDGGFAVATTRAESAGTGDVFDAYDGMEIVDLSDDETTPFLLEGAGLGVAFDDEGHVLLLQEGQDYLYRYDLFARTEDRVKLSAPPLGIGALPDGPIWITQAEASGLVTFLTEPRQEVGGFALHGIADEIELVDLGAR